MVFLFILYYLFFVSIDLDTTGVVEGDHDPPQSMGDPNAEVSLIIKKYFNT